MHQQLVQEKQQQQQLAQEEAAKLKAALAKAIGWAIAHQPGVAPTPVSAKPGLAVAQQQPGESSLVVPLQPGEGSLVVPQHQPGGSPAQKRSSNPSYGPRRPGLAASQHQSIEGQGLSMPITDIQNAISWSNSEPQNKFINKANRNMVPHPNSVPQTNQNSVPQTSNTLAHQANPIRQFFRKSILKSTKNFQKRSKFSRQKFKKFRQISMSKNVIRMVLGRPRKKFSHKNIISNKIPKKLLKH
jgi:hypothetical protein